MDEIKLPPKIDLTALEIKAVELHINLGQSDIEKAKEKCNELLSLIQETRKISGQWRSVMFQIANGID